MTLEFMKDFHIYRVFWGEGVVFTMQQLESQCQSAVICKSPGYKSRTTLKKFFC